MNILSQVFLYYSLLLSFFILLSSPTHVQLIFLPVVLYLVSKSLNKKSKSIFLVRFFTFRLFLYYSFIVSCILVITGFLSVKSLSELVSSLLFSPLLFYLGSQVLPKKKAALFLPEVIPPPELARHIPTNQTIKKGLDNDRRIFIKLIGSAGLSLFLFSIFSKKAHGAFFGSVPGPGTVTLKDISGNQIDPAQNHPTDGYKISELDDSSPAYYGFLEKGGAWYILKEASDGTYRYVKGASSFSTNWTNRASLSYDYYHNVF